MTDTNTGVARTADQLADADRTGAAALVRAVTEADTFSPLSEDGRLALTHGRPGARHFVWHGPDKAGAGAEGTDDAVLGYLYLSPPDDAQGRTAEVCVAPASRRHGIGQALVEAALAETAGTLHVWAHGSLPGTDRFAEQLGFTSVRELRLMELDLAAHPAGAFRPPQSPEGIELGTFRPGVDEDAWLTLNARAFAHHPEQGSWTRRDLAEREAEPWFDPAGFFLARAADGPIGFHWTKVHPAGAYGPDRVGEIYVLGVDPSAGGRGLGRWLALVGLQHLEQSGLDNVILYVDGDNTPAVRLYQSLGFGTRAVDTLYERRGSAA